MNQNQVLALLEQEAKAVGLELFGCTQISNVIPNKSCHQSQDEKEFLDNLQSRYDNWLELGYQGTMKFLETHKDLKFHPSKLLPGCTHIAIAALNYYQSAPWKNGTQTTQTKIESQHEQDQGRIARYAWGRDYHKVFPKLLKQVASHVLGKEHQGTLWRVLVDANPLDERFFAFNSNLGFTGRHTLTINHDKGSWFFLGALLLNLQDFPIASNEKNPVNTGNTTERPLIDPFTVSGSTHQGSCPKSCFRCLQVCPTGAIKSPYVLDASRCISYLTIEHKGLIDEELRPLMGDWIFGCDLCQEVCPFNLKAQITKVQDFLTQKAGPLESLSEILLFRTQEEFVRKFAGTPIMRAGRESIVRNAAIAAGNRKSLSLVPVLKKALHDESSVVRDHVQWALDQILKQQGHL